MKLDIEKTFDKINWNFIDFMLLKKSFSLKWRNWIRQRDPISPFIFVLVMDYLSNLLKFLEVQNKIRGVRFNGDQISLIFYLQTIFYSLLKMMKN